MKTTIHRQDGTSEEINALEATRQALEASKALNATKEDKLHDEALMKEHFSLMNLNPEMLEAYKKGVKEGKWRSSIEYCRTFMPLKYYV